MDKQRKRIVFAFIVFLCVVVLFFFLIVGYAIHEGHIAGYGDIFRNEADSEEAVWVRLAILAVSLAAAKAAGAPSACRSTAGLHT